MEVYPWERLVINAASAYPRSGPLFVAMHFFSHPGKFFWITALCLVALLSWFNRQYMIPIMLSAISMGLGDLISQRLIKETVMRPRPGFLEQGCFDSGCWGFVSSHATNMFAMTTVLACYDCRTLFFTGPITMLVCISRIYLLDHFPLDIIGGTLLGVGLGLAVWGVYWKSKPKMVMAI